MWQYNYSDELMHFGVPGMKWGVRKYQNKDGTLTEKGKKKYRANESDSSVTKKVKVDLSKMTGKEFRQKYQVSNTRYMKRVDKYIDPYMNSPLAKFGKKLEAEAKKNAERWTNKALKKMEVKNTRIQKDIDSFKPYVKTGIKGKSGRLLLTPKEVAETIEALEKVKRTPAQLGKRKAEKAKIKRGKEKAKSIIEQYGDKYPVTVDKKGIVSIKIGDDLWKIGY